MPSATKLSKWGNSLAIRIPLSVARAAHLAEGDPVSVSVRDDGSVVLRRTAPRYQLEDLVKQIKPSNRHQSVDWGSPAGKEVW
jgi:antitoxin MazE